MSKVRAFLEYYAAAAKGVPAGRKAEEALVELGELERSAEARGFERARGMALTLISVAASAWHMAAAASDDPAVKGRHGARCGALDDMDVAIRAMKDETP